MGKEVTYLASDESDKTRADPHKRARASSLLLVFRAVSRKVTISPS